MHNSVLLLQEHLRENHYLKFIAPVEEITKEEFPYADYEEFILYNMSEHIELSPKNMSRITRQLIDETKKRFQEAVYHIRNISLSSRVDDDIAYLQNQIFIFKSLLKSLNRDCEIENEDSRFHAKFEPEPFPYISPLLQKMPVFKNQKNFIVNSKDGFDNYYIEIYKFTRFLSLIEIPYTLLNCCILFLNEMATQLNLLIHAQQPKEVISSNLVWNGTNTELVELGKGLLENGSIKDSHKKGKQKELFDTLSKTFNFDIKLRDKTLQDIKKRSNGSETLFMDNLKSALSKWITRK